MAAGTARLARRVSVCENGAPEPRIAAWHALLKAGVRSVSDQSTIHTHRSIAHRLLRQYDQALQDY